MSAYDVAFVGFGEAARAFVEGWRGAGGGGLSIAAYDILFDDSTQAESKRAECAELGVTPLEAASLATAAAIVVSAVTPDQAVVAARSVAEHVDPDALYLDINSAAPDCKREAAALIGRGYVDVAVMAPVGPRRHLTPLLIGGPGAARCTDFLDAWQMDYEIVSAEVGPASTVKMIRSVFVKGLESVTFECALAAYRAGVADRVFPSLANVLRFTDGEAQADYMMQRVAVHGTRRAAEMREVARTLADLGLEAIMAEATARQQDAIGALRLGDVDADAAAIAAAVLTLREAAP